MTLKTLLIISGSILISINNYAIVALNTEGSHPGQNDYGLLYQHLQYKVGLSLGFQSPYSAGLEFSLLFNELVDVNMGFGFGFVRAKFGIGSRIFPLREKNFSPMFGAYLYHTTGVPEVTVYVNSDEAVYRITPDQALLLNTGFRIRFGKGSYWIAGIGYSIPFRGDKAVYVSGSTAESVQTFANLFATGGLSFNAGLLIKLSKGNYRLSRSRSTDGPYTYP